jgi:hypothetical protein
MYLAEPVKHREVSIWVMILAKIAYSKFGMLDARLTLTAYSLLMRVGYR